LVVDEVLAVGDAEFQKKAIGKMQDVSRGEGRTVLFVSHNMGSIQQLCNKSILLKDGSVHFSGDTQSVIDFYLNDRNENFIQRNDQWIKSIDNRLKLKMPYFVDTANQIKEEFAQGETVKVVFELDFIDLFKKVEVGIALDDMRGNRILTSHSIDDENLQIGNNTLKGKVKFLCTLKSEYLSAQRYKVYYGMRDESNTNIYKSQEPLLFTIANTRHLDGGSGILVNAGFWSCDFSDK